MLRAEKRMPLFLLHYYLLPHSIFLILLLKVLMELKETPEWPFIKNNKQQTKQVNFQKQWATNQ